MKAKPIKLLWCTLILAVATAFSGCKRSNLDLLPHNPTEAAFFQTESDFTKAVFGIYAKLDYFFWYNGAGGYGGVASLQNVLLLPGDDITTTGGNPFETFGPIEPSNGLVSDFYTYCYQTISRANTVLQKLNEVKPGVYTTPNLQNYHRGEALFLRAFANYYLWTYFGTAPLDTVRVTEVSQFYPGNTSGTQLIDQSIADLTQAASLLPDSWDVANRGRVTKASAWGMLGKCQVFKACYTKNAADFAAAVTSLANVTGRTLVPNFDDNFAADAENNDESLFEYQATQATSLDNVWLNPDFGGQVGNLSVYWAFYLNPGQEQFAGPKFVGTQKLANTFEAGDPRKALTMDTSNNIKKYVTRDALDQVGVGSLNNPRLLRLADVKLLQAEAVLQSGGSTADAIGFINEVRQRARGTGTVPADRPVTETDKNTIMQWIMDERLIELAGEGQRWPDVRRWALEGILTLDNAFFNSLGTNMKWDIKNLYFPIPTSETDVNTNVKQNPGY